MHYLMRDVPALSVLCSAGGINCNKAFLEWEMV